MKGTTAMNAKRVYASALAMAAALALPATASAQQQCITEQELSALVVYGVPLAMEAAQTTCAPTLSPTGFMATDGEMMQQRYAALSNDTWPTAFRAFSKFAGSDDKEMFTMMREMPEESIRPFIDELLTGMIAGEINTDDCYKVERIAEALAVLEPAEAGNLVAVIASVAGLDNPSVCPLEQ